jgi:hypothetical protein
MKRQSLPLQLQAMPFQMNRRYKKGTGSSSQDRPDAGPWHVVSMRYRHPQILTILIQEET